VPKAVVPLPAPGALHFVPAAMLGSWVMPLAQRLPRDHGGKVNTACSGGG